MEPEHVVPGYLAYRCTTIDGSGISRTTQCAVDTCPWPIKTYIVTLLRSGKGREGDLTRLIREDVKPIIIIVLGQDFLCDGAEQMVQPHMAIKCA
jgi:hypothetical protein